MTLTQPTFDLLDSIERELSHLRETNIDVEMLETVDSIMDDVLNLRHDLIVACRVVGRCATRWRAVR